MIPPTATPGRRSRCPLLLPSPNLVWALGKGGPSLGGCWTPVTANSSELHCPEAELPHALQAGLSKRGSQATLTPFVRWGDTVG